MATLPNKIELGKIDSDVLERIVCEVARRLRELPPTTITPAASISPATISATSSVSTTHLSAAHPPENIAPANLRIEKNDCRQGGETTSAVPSAAAVVRLEAPVVTLADVADRLAGVREVVVGAQAVLTPAVRDLLSQQRIALTRTDQENLPQTGRTPLLVASSMATGAALESYWRQLSRLGLGFQQIAGSSLPGILQELAVMLRAGDRQGVLVTDQLAAAHCLANRQPGVRAILATGVTTVRGDTQAVGANLLVVSPRGRSAYQLGNMAKEFCRQGVLPCPEKYRPWLGKE